MQWTQLRRKLGTSVLVLAAVLAAGCESPSPVAKAEPDYTPREGSVGFDLVAETGHPGSPMPARWLASHKSRTHTAQFRIELESPQKSSTDIGNISFGKGRFVAVKGSDNTALMAELKKALEAKRLPAKITRVDSLSFTYAIIGDELYRQPDGGLSGDKKGNWLAIKLFLRDGEGEVYINVNLVMGKGEFSIKDEEYGDIVVGELAKVL